MKKIGFVAAVAAIALMSSGASAGGLWSPNGLNFNGLNFNGLNFNSLNPNGLNFNGLNFNGHITTGAKIATFEVETVTLPNGQRIRTK